jgi:iron(III) transport system permease protein
MLFGNNGIITNLFNLEWSIYGLPGIIIGSVLYSFPVAFLMFSDILKYQDYAPYAAADVLGISKIRQFKTITVPFLKKPFISVLFATFTLIVTDYGIPLSVGGQFKTLPVMLYEEAVGLLNYSAGSVIGLTLLVPAVIAFLVDLLGKDSAKSENVSQKFIITWKTLRDVLCYALCIIVTLFTALIFLSFCIQAFAKSYPNDMSFTFDNFKTTFKRSGLEYLGNSLLISLLTAVVGTALSFVLAYLTARTKTKSSKVLHLMAITSLAIPGLVLGLSYVIVFKKTFFYGSLAILVMVNCVHFLASPYLMVYNAMGKINENIEDVGSILGISRAKIIWKVIIPQTKYTLIEMLSYFFVNSMMTISAVSFLATLGNRPLSLLINQFEARAKMECAAVVAIMIFAVNFIIKVVIGYFKRRGGAR